MCLTSSAIEKREDEREEKDDRVEDFLVRPTVGLDTRLFLQLVIAIGVAGRIGLVELLVWLVDLGDFLVGCEELGVTDLELTLGVKQGVRDTDFLTGVFSLSLAADLGVPIDF